MAEVNQISGSGVMGTAAGTQGTTSPPPNPQTQGGTQGAVAGSTAAPQTPPTVPGKTTPVVTSTAAVQDVNKIKNNLDTITNQQQNLSATNASPQNPTPSTQTQPQNFVGQQYVNGGLLQYGPTNPDGTRYELFTPNVKDPSTQTTPTGSTTPPSSTQTTPGQSGRTSDFDKQLSDLQSQSEQAYNEYKNSVTQLQNGTLPLTPDQQAQIGAIQAQFDRLKQQQALANKNYESAMTQIGIASGRSRYAPEIAQGEIANAVNVGLQKISEIDSKAAEVIVNMKNAFHEKNFEVLKSLYESYSGFMKDKTDMLFKMKGIADEKERDLREFNYRAAQDEIQNKFKEQESDRQATQWALSYQLNSNQFDYQQKKDSIEQAFQERKITQDQANQLMDYNLKVKQLEQGKYIVTQDSMGQPVAFNTRTGQFENTLINKAAQESGLGSPQSIAYQDALVGLNLSKDTNASVKKQLDSLLQNGDITRAKDLIFREAIKSAPTEQQNQAYARLQAIESLNNINTLLNAYVKKSGDTGIWKGTVEQAAEKIGKTNDPELAKIGSQIAQAIQTYRKGMSGSAFSESEQKEYAGIFPNFKDTAQLNNAKITSLLDSFNRQQKVFMSASIGGKNYDEIFGKPQYQSLSAFKLAEPDKFSKLAPIIQENDLDEQDVLKLLNKIDLQGGFNEPLGMGENGPDQKSIRGTLEKIYPEGAKGGQCGSFAYHLVNIPPVGDSIAAKQATIKKYGMPTEVWRQNPQIGDVIITNESKEYGHVAVVNQILPDGTMMLTESNFKGPEKVSHTRTLPLNSPRILGALRGKLRNNIA